MSEIIIKTENLGKKYTIGHQADSGGYVALRDVLMRNAQNLLAKTKDLVRSKPVIIGDTTEEFWALKDLNFEIRKGEALGIIGRNGAGKSTLLKVLSRITEPSAGRVTIKGRVASLLEVGTGFHPELTGRENIFLNGAILGMKRSEIKAKFDEIVAFAEVEKFLDTPVKRYSSGMYVRLAFAVAAHLEPEILLVDEVLAVGDMAFQKKCLGKMGDVAKEGRTILFVSHNLSAIQSLCNRAILLRDGLAILDGETPLVVQKYVEPDATQTDFNSLDFRKDRKDGDKLRFRCCKFISNRSGDTGSLFCGDRSVIELHFESFVSKIENLRFGILFKDGVSGVPLIELNSYYAVSRNLKCKRGKSKISFIIKKFPLAPGEHVVSLISTSGLEVLDWIKDVGTVTINEGNYYDTGRMPLSNDTRFHYDFECKLEEI